MPAMLSTGRYELQEEIGVGASARVFRALDADLKRTVAVKVLHPHLRTEGHFALRFRREASAVARIEHPNILRIYDVAPEDHDPLYFVSEYVDGGTVAQWLDEEGGRLPHEMALAVALQVLRGLQAAHEAGIVHRDLKPENLMLTRGGQVKIADFGVAFREADGSITVDGNLLGSPSYMAPEQIDGDPVDARTDLFAFGIILYQMLTGSLPFGDGQMTQILNRIATADHAPLPELDATVDPRVVEIVEACLSLDPGDRPSTAAGLHERIADILRRRAVDDPAEAIRRFREADEAARKETSYATVNSLVAEARELLAGARNVTLAMALLDRALALHPFHFEAYRLVQSIGGVQKRRSVRVGLLAVLLTVAVIGLFQAWTVLRGAAPVPESPARSVLTAPEPDSPARPAEPTLPPGPREPTRKAPAGAAGEAKAPAKPATATLRLASRPWAKVFLDEEFVGETPLLRDLALPPGRHVVRLQNPRSQAVSLEIDARAGETIDRFVELPIFPALLRIGAAPGDTVLLDGNPVDSDALSQSIEVAHGERNVTFRNGDRERTIVIDAQAGRLSEVPSPFLATP